MPRATTIKYKIGQKPPTVVDPVAIKNEMPPQPLSNFKGNVGKDCKPKVVSEKVTAKPIAISKTEVCDVILWSE